MSLPNPICFDDIRDGRHSVGTGKNSGHLYRYASESEIIDAAAVFGCFICLKVL